MLSNCPKRTVWEMCLFDLDNMKIVQPPGLKHLAFQMTGQALSHQPCGWIFLATWEAACRIEGWTQWFVCFLHNSNLKIGCFGNSQLALAVPSWNFSLGRANSERFPRCEGNPLWTINHHEPSRIIVNHQASSTISVHYWYCWLLVMVVRPNGLSLCFPLWEHRERWCTAACWWILSSACSAMVSIRPSMAIQLAHKETRSSQPLWHGGYIHHSLYHNHS